MTQSLIRDVIVLSKDFFTGTEKRYAIGMSSTILALSLSTVGLEFLFNAWRGRFYDALQTLNAPVFWQEVITFSILAACFILVATLSTYLLQCFSLRWRLYTTHQFLTKWSALDDRSKIENGDQRIQEDLRIFTRQVPALFSGVVNATAIIIVFTPILYSLSTHVPVAFIGVQPGSLCLIALVFALGGSYFCFKLGRKIPTTEYNNQRVEANFRYKLVQLKDVKKAQNVSFDSTTYDLKMNYTELFKQFKIFGFASGTYFQAAVIIPYLLIGGGFFTAAITLGVLMQVAQAMGKMNDSMSYLLDRYLDIAELKSVVRRLTEFRESLLT